VIDSTTCLMASGGNSPKNNQNDTKSIDEDMV